MKQQDIPQPYKSQPQNHKIVCACGKQYKSYPSAYSHVKIKHGMYPDTTYIASINDSRRQRQQPKKRPFKLSPKNFIQHSIQQISQLLKPVFGRVFLQQNQQREQSEMDFRFKQFYRELDGRFLTLNPIQRFPLEEPLIRLSQIVNKNFSCEVACRIDFALEVINCNQESKQPYQLRELKKFNLWRGQERVDQILMEVYKKWRKIMKKQGKSLMKIQQIDLLSSAENVKVQRDYQIQ